MPQTPPPALFFPICSHSDNNVKLIVLDRLQELKEKHREVGTAVGSGW